MRACAPLTDAYMADSGGGTEVRVRHDRDGDTHQVHRTGARHTLMVDAPDTERIRLQFAELKRVERDHAKEKQKLVKDKDAGA